MSKRFKTLLFYYAMQCIGLCLILPAESEARDKHNPLILCLGREEEIIHEGKSAGPLYKLNQDLINKLVVASDLRIKTFYLNKICNSQLYSPSLKLLHMLLTDGKKIFSIPKSNNPRDPMVFQITMIEELINYAPDIFLRFLSDLQGVTPIAHCLEKNIPELNKVFDRAKYLRGEITEKDVFHSDDLTNKIFNKLVYFNTFYKKCEKKKLMKENKKRARK